MPVEDINQQDIAETLAVIWHDKADTALCQVWVARGVVREKTTCQLFHHLFRPFIGQVAAAKDKDENDVFLADSAWILKVCREDFPDIRFYTTSEFKVDLMAG
mgnify:CR=1 FL=1